MRKKIENFIYWVTLIRPIYAILLGAYKGIKNLVVAEQLNEKNFNELQKWYKDLEDDE